MPADLLSPTEPSTSQAPSTSTAIGTNPDRTTEAIYARVLAYDFDADPDYIAGLASILGHPETPPTREELDGNGEFVTRVKCFYFTRKFGLGDVDPDAWGRWAAAQGPRGEEEEVRAAVGAEETNTAGTLASGRLPVDSGNTTFTTPSDSTSGPSTYSTLTAPPDASPTAQQHQPTPQEGPPYPLSFSAIVDLITRNVPVPGIETVPDTVLEHGSSKVDHTAKRKKPWEKDVSAGSTELGTASALSSFGLAGSTTPADGPTSAQEPTPDSNGQRISNESIVNGHLSTGEGVVKILQPNAIPDSGLLAKE
ncbi:uncharacterized protein AB675_3087 [Cyphellophora attinorum]|uniref:Uncharacterized protein n=1 Tax=Cyphellophora attinorum TaxID=1664694 RepID=A0A0N1H1C6_9EURO|nr:uncharacterized protein AB675_3087 [Phialophora attinorum]KPI37870.1 hypothetical protein AB675_3087 [Phialophora attinorum]